LKQQAVVAAGHELTAEAAALVLAEGGNAYDAAIAAFFAACVAEPVLASLAGGGFLIAQGYSDNAPSLYDFFVQTPGRVKSDQLDFFPIHADFGSTRQEFHIGRGSVAVPGCVAGMFHVHRELASMPMAELVAPAIEFARQGVKLNHFQAYIHTIIAPILLHTPATISLYGQANGDLKTAGDHIYQPQLADTLDVLAHEGERLFYEGEIAALFAQLGEAGGLLQREDLQQYRSIRRQPLYVRLKNASVYINPPPSSGGVLTGFGLKLLERLMQPDWHPDSIGYLQQLAKVLTQTELQRESFHVQNKALALLCEDDVVNRSFNAWEKHPPSRRGTTHISIMDHQGNRAGLTVSNGEGCGYLLEDTGIMPNNMLGEEDLNPAGFFNWQPSQRMTSMMSPSLVNFADGRKLVTGSGGSNRIRTALLQVMSQLIFFHSSLEQAVCSPRLHVEKNFLYLENFSNEGIHQALQQSYPEHKYWEAPNLYFGGAHSVMGSARGVEGVGDPRRGGVSRIVG